MPRILTKLRIDEVSSVDHGAGEGVKIMLMKRDDNSSRHQAHQIEKGQAMTGFNVVKIAKSIVDDGEAPLTEHELTKMISDFAQHDRRSGETGAQAFARVFSADTDEGSLFRKAVAIAKTLPLMITEPVQVGGAAAQDVDDPTDALAHLQKLADEQRRRAPEFTKEQAFAKVYSDPNNAPLVAKERRQNRPRAGG